MSIVIDPLIFAVSPPKLLFFVSCTAAAGSKHAAGKVQTVTSPNEKARVDEKEAAQWTVEIEKHGHVTMKPTRGEADVWPQDVLLLTEEAEIRGDDDGGQE